MTAVWSLPQELLMLLAAVGLLPLCLLVSCVAQLVHERWLNEVELLQDHENFLLYERN